MSSPKTSKPDSSATRTQPLPAFDKLYWFRTGSAAVAGLGTAFLQSTLGTDWTIGLSIGIFVYLVTYYVAIFAWYRGLSKEGQGKVYTTAVGSYVMVFLFTWLLLFTLSFVGYSL